MTPSPSRLATSPLALSAAALTVVGVWLLCAVCSFALLKSEPLTLSALPALGTRLVSALAGPHTRTFWSAIAACLALPVALSIMAAADRSVDPGAATLYGSASWASPADLRAAHLTDSRGIFVGKCGWQSLYVPGETFVMVSAPTRAGKGVGLVIPNLLQWHGSVLCLDLKGENFRKTAGFISRYHRVFNFRPGNANTHRWNPLDSVSKDPDDRPNEVIIIATALFPAGLTDPFWDNAPRDLFVALVLFLLETEQPVATIAKVVEIASSPNLTKNMEKWSSVLSDYALSPACRQSMQRFIVGSAATRASIVLSLTTVLATWSLPRYAAATSASDFDLSEIRRERMTIFFGCELNATADAKQILELFITMAVALNVKTMPEVDATLALPCLLLFDEFTALGKIAPIVSAVATMAAYGLRLLTVIQSESQLESKYGLADARTLIDNHATRIFFAPTDMRDAKKISELLGDTTVTINVGQESTSSAGGRVTRTRGSRTMVVARPLMLPAEVYHMDPLRIVQTRNVLPILCNESPFFADLDLKWRTLFWPPKIPKLVIDPALYHPQRIIDGRMSPGTAAPPDVGDRQNPPRQRDKKDDPDLGDGKDSPGHDRK